MASFVPRNPETLEDRARYTSDGLTTVACMDCLVSVRVRKNSEQQTAIQWSIQTQQQCPVLSGRDSIHDGCPRLNASIDAHADEDAIEEASA